MDASDIIGRSGWTQSIRSTVLQAARYRSTVLITGPSGTGKELIAAAIHRHSPRRAGPYVPVDCTSLSGELFASHLFGHVQGAFTGANHERLGCFRVAEKGTIFLDEVGELSPELQSKLLRTIQERVVVPVGNDRPVPVDVRIVAATNRDLANEVRLGRFRLDLFYRLNVVSIETQPLCDRVDDIKPLADYFLDKLAVEHGLPSKQLTRAAVEALEKYSWPGNVRQLQNVLERMAIFAAGNVIGADLMPLDVIAPDKPTPSQSPRFAEEHCPDEPARWDSLADVECQHIRATLAHTFYNQTAAAHLLHIDRATLARKVRQYRIGLAHAHRGRPPKKPTEVVLPGLLPLAGDSQDP